jgi:hypothetical protein
VNQSGKMFLFFLTKYPKAESKTYVFAQSSFDLMDHPEIPCFLPPLNFCCDYFALFVCISNVSNLVTTAARVSTYSNFVDVLKAEHRYHNTRNTQNMLSPVKHNLILRIESFYPSRNKIVYYSVHTKLFSSMARRLFRLHILDLSFKKL